MNKKAGRVGDEAKKTIWHLCSNRWNSAITEYALSCARALKGEGHNVVVTPLADSFCQKRALSYSLDTRAAASFKIGSIGVFRSLCQQINPDVIFTYGGQENFLTKLLSTHAKIIRFRGQAIPDDMTFSLRHKMSHSHVDLVVSPAEWLTKELSSVGGSARAETVMLGCDEEVFKKTNQKISSDLVVLGRLDPVKGHESIIKMMAALLSSWPKSRPEPRLHIVGEPANLSASHIKGYAEKAGLKLGENFIITTKRVSDIKELLSSALVGVIPSLDSEIICRVAEEFSLCGAPIFVSGAGSLDEVLFKDSGRSYRGLSEEDSVSMLRDAVFSAFDEPQEDRQCRAERAHKLFSLKTMGKRLNEVLLDLGAIP